MPNAGRQIWQVRVLRDVELTLVENRNEQEQNRNNEKRTKKNGELKKKDEKNERWMKGQWKMIFHEMILGQITWNTIWAYLSFLSKP